MSEITVIEAAKRLRVTPRRVRLLCAQGRIKGVRRIGKEGCGPWLIRLRSGRIIVTGAKMGPNGEWKDRG